MNFEKEKEKGKERDYKSIILMKKEPFLIKRINIQICCRL